MLKAKDIFIDEKSNLLVIRDTPEVIHLAEKLIAMQDLNEPEVMLDVEVLEVQRSRLLAMGIQWPSQMTFTPVPNSSAPVLSDLKHLNSDRIGITLPSATVNLQHDLGDANILANPRIRVRDREKAKIMIGDKLPVSTSTTTATGVISESIQYLDVGIKLEVEPNISLNGDVAIKMGLEVSSVTNEVHTPGGSLAYQIGSRSASTVLSLKDGETQVLAGLINDQDRSNASRIPGLGDIPLLGRLFGTQSDNHQKTEIVLSITPHLIRNLHRPAASDSLFWSGTDSLLRTKPLSLKYVQTAETPSSEKTALPANENKSENNNGDPDGSTKAPSMIGLNWQGPQQIKVGDQFKLTLKMKTDGGVRSLPMQLGYDPSVLQVMEITEGPFFKQNDATTSISKNIDANTGKMFVTVVRSGNDGAIGEGDVVTIAFRALAAKPTTEIKVLSAAPVSMGNKAITPMLPPPYSINISN
jgi:general secretion pathway protein D